MADFFSENLAPSVTQETDAALVALGQRGCVCIFDEAFAIGNFAAIQCITDNVFVTLDTVEGTGANSPFSPLVNNVVTFPAGTIIYGPFTTIQNSAGQSAICYKA
jgi:hypothetical protein